MFTVDSKAASQPQAGPALPFHADTATLESRMVAAVKLHEFLAARHWNGRALCGPDVGIRFNSRIGRFIKSYFDYVSWNDSYSYIQAQGYWVLGNWRLFSIFGEAKYRSIAERCSDYMLAQQREDGAWDYPNPEWSGRVATAEGTWGSLGLLESYRQTGERRFLESVRKWHHFLIHKIGFQQFDDELAVNYFYGRTGLRVPNNSAIVVRFLAELAEADGSRLDARLRSGLLRFLQAVQAQTGEFPYTVRGESGGVGWPHFQCYQYNAFMCLDLMRYHELTGDDAVIPLIRRLLGFLTHGLAKDGRSFFDCHDRHREVTYHTAVLAHTFARAGSFGIEGYGPLAERAYAYLLGLQKPSGGFGFSRGDYFILHDQRSYPRNLAMILFHLLPASSAPSPPATRIH